MFGDPSNQRCVNCNPTCKTCTGPTDKDCGCKDFNGVIKCFCNIGAY